MKRLLCFLLLACLLPLCGQAQILSSSTPEADSVAFAKVRARMDSIRQSRPTVGLVLAGGGARGLAHLGVIKYMEELGIPVDVVTGTSMGGLVGGLYAMGYKHDQLDSLVRAIEWPVMMSDNIPQKYISYKLRKYRETYVLRLPHHYDDEDLADRLKNERIIDKMAEESGNSSADMLTESIGRMGMGLPDGYLYGLNVRNMLSSVSVGYQDSISFADLPIPFACVATDLYAMAPKYWTSGSIRDALRSTMAIPFYFRAVRKDGEVLLDGGMRNNYPADLAKKMGADIIIGSDMAIHRELNELNTPVDFLLQTITLLSSSANGPAREMLDIGVHHELKGYTMLSFDDESVDDIIDQGYQNAIANKALFESIAAVVSGRRQPAVASHTPAVNLAQRKVAVGDVRISGITESEQHQILHSIEYPGDGMYDRDIIERLLNYIYGTNAFESVTYHMEGREEPYTLVFECQKGQTNDFAAGLRADTDETVALAVHYGLGTRCLVGPRLAVDLKLGTNPSMAVEGSYKPRLGLPSIGVALRGRLLNSSSGYLSESDQRILFMAADAFVEDTHLHYGIFRTGVTYEMKPYERYLGVDDLRWTSDKWYKDYWLSAFASFKLDTFNDGYFPTRGARMSLNGRYVFSGHDNLLDANEGYHEEWDPVTPGGAVPDYFVTSASFEAALPIGDRFTILPTIRAGWSDLTSRAGKGPDYDAPDLNYQYMNPLHILSIGGFIPNRYTEHQIPFFGMPTAYTEAYEFVGLAQLDLRYCFLRKNFVYLRSAALFQSEHIQTLFTWDKPFMAYGAEYARQTMFGPLRLAVQWNKLAGVTAYAAIGFEF